MARHKLDNDYSELAVGKFIVIKLPYWADMAYFGGIPVCGSWADEWVYQTARIEFHSWCDDFNYKIRLVPVGQWENRGVERSWYTSDMLGYMADGKYRDGNIKVFSSLAEAEEYRRNIKQ